jgi:hypothetical protein
MNPDRRARYLCFCLVRDGTKLTTVVVLKTLANTSWARPGATLGATRMNNLRMTRTRPDNKERRGPGHGPF